MSNSIKIKLNYGCGETKLSGFVNLDSSESTKPDVIADFKKGQLPFENESVELIHMIHSLGHIESNYWPFIFLELYRVLTPEGELRLAYPEFERCANNYIENYLGLREFWKWTLFGRQLYPGDYHVNPMRTSEIIDLLSGVGFHEIKSGPEPEETYNTFLITKKGPKPLLRADILKREIFQ